MSSGRSFVMCEKCFTSCSLNMFKLHFCDGAGNMFYQCDQCTYYKTHTAANMRCHKFRHRNEKFVCDFCSFRTRSEDVFTTHQVKHQQVTTQYYCKYCRLSMKNASLFNTHILMQMHIVNVVLSLESNVDE